ncbi:MAG: signal peptidase II [Ignavibacteriae bacterium]|nr:signal peptidase II [Ignavibacteria bacterium]MBI3364650.1 signal peptidase II [Ignavibacteriota bacterium]
MQTAFRQVITSPRLTNKTVKILNLSIFIILADQITKLTVKGISIPILGIRMPGLPLGTSRPIFGDLLRLTYIENPGMAFGIDLGGKLFFSIFSILASIGILMYLYKARNENLAFRIALALILGGAVGNLIDRVFYGVLFSDAPLFHGKVVDFIDADFFNINFFGYHLTRWPVFNIADASVTCGVILMLFSHRKTVQEESTLAAPAGVSPDGTSAPIVSAPVISSDSQSPSTGSEPSPS